MKIKMDAFQVLSEQQKRFYTYLHILQKQHILYFSSKLTTCQLCTVFLPPFLILGCSCSNPDHKQKDQMKSIIINCFTSLRYSVAANLATSMTQT